MRHVVGIAHQQLQRVPSRRQVEPGLGLAEAEMQVLAVVRDLLVERRQVGVDDQVMVAGVRLLHPGWRHAAWLEEGILLRRMDRLAGIPGVLIHGRLDLGSPLATAWELHRAWPGSELVVLEEAGHDGRDTGMAEAAVAAIRRVADRAPAG